MDPSKIIQVLENTWYETYDGNEINRQQGYEFLLAMDAICKMYDTINPLESLIPYYCETIEPEQVDQIHHDLYGHNSKCQS